MSSSGAAALARARAAVDLDRWDTAAEEARRAIAAEPTNAEAHGVLAQALNGRGDKKGALAALAGALKLEPDNEWLHRLRGSFLIESRPREALAAVDEAVRLAPEVAWGHGLRARCLDKLNDRLEARKAIARALELAPRSGWLHRTRGDIALHDLDPVNAELGYREALKHDAHDAVALNNLGVALQRQGRHEEAALAFKTAVLTDPTMQVAKQNTHSAVKNLGGAVAAGAGVTGLGAAKFCAIGGAHTITASATGSSNDLDVFIAIVVIVIALGALVALIGLPIRRKRAESRVKKLDPQLWQMYQQLERDKRAGRL